MLLDINANYKHNNTAAAILHDYFHAVADPGLGATGARLAHL